MTREKYAQSIHMIPTDTYMNVKNVKVVMSPMYLLHEGWHCMRIGNANMEAVSKRTQELLVYRSPRSLSRRLFHAPGTENVPSTSVRALVAERLKPLYPIYKQTNANRSYDCAQSDGPRHDQEHLRRLIGCA